MSAVDPVCRGKVNEAHAGATVEYARRTYYFCRPDCKAEFVRNPELYVHDVDARIASSSWPPSGAST